MAAAGRSEARLRAAVAACGAPSVPVGVIVADTADPASLSAMASRSRLLVNAVGPYAPGGVGVRVAAACVAAGCDYLDVSGEPLYLETAEAELHDRARDAGVLVVTSCGFDSVPADLGAQFAAAAFRARHGAGAVLSRVDSYLSSRGPVHGHFATYESAVNGVASAPALRRLRRAAGRPPLAPPGPRPAVPARPTWDERLGAWVAPFPGSDASVVRRTQQRLLADGAAPFHYTAAFLLYRRASVIKYTVLGSLAMALAPYRAGRRLLLALPRVFTAGHFSRAGPSDAEMARAGFRMEIRASGWAGGGDRAGPARGAGAAAGGGAPDREVRVAVSGPEMGYVATPIIVGEAALTVLAERAGITRRVGPGGVFTPAPPLFATAGYIERLRAAGVTFDEL